MLRHYLYEAAGCLLMTVTAVARKLAVLLLGLWKREDHFRAAPRDSQAL